VHRDVKPDNIFLTRVAGREDFVKVLDFGISKVRGVTGTSAQLTQTGAVLGTPAYMSPEQARGETDVDARTDVWATGVVVFEMLTGRVPFLGANYNHVLYQVLSAPIPSVRSLRQAVTPELEAAVLGALERDTARRHPSAAAFRKALFVASLAAGEPAAAVAAQGSGPSGQGSDQQPATKDQELPAVASGERTVAAEPTVGATAVPLRTTPGVWGRVRRHRTQIVAAGVLLLAIAVGAVLVVARGGSGGEGPGSGDEAKGGGLQGEGSGVRTQGSGIEVPAAGTVPAGEPATDRPRLTPETISPGAVGPAKAEPAETSAPPVEEHTPAPPPVTPAAPASPPPVVNHRRPADAGTAATASHGRDVATRPRDAGTGLDRAAAPPATIAAAATADAGAPPGQQPTTGGQQPRTRAGASPDTGTVSATVDGGPRVGDIPIRTTHRDAAGRVEVIPIRTTHGGDR
jgi:serine/threonine-protein kinase